MPQRGVRVWAAGEVGGTRARVLAVAAALPGTALGGWAAAYLWGCGDLDGLSPGGLPLPVPLCPGRSGRVVAKADRQLLRSSLAAGDVVEVDGVACTSAVRTAFDVARTAACLHDAVALLDAVLRALPGLAVVDLADYTAERARWKGVDRVRSALALADRRSASLQESWLRCVWVLDAGLPRPEVNVPVLVDDGRPLGHPDLLDLASGLVGEYDGWYHRTPRQQHADAVREQQMVATGLTFVRASALDRASPLALVHRLREGHQRSSQVTRRTWWVPPSALT